MILILKKLQNLKSVFSFEITFIQKEWGSVLMIIQILLMIYVSYKILNFMKKYIQSFGFLQPSSIPGVNANKQQFYLSVLISIYKKGTEACPALCVLLNSMLGLCLVYGKDGLFRWSLLSKPAVAFFKAETVEALLSNVDLTNKSWGYKLLRPIMGNGLVTSQGIEWRNQRKLLTPTFHFSILDECIPVFQKQSNILISKIKSRISEPWIDIAPLSKMCSLDIICETAMGVSMSFQSTENCDYSMAISECEEIFIHRLLRPWLYPDIIFNMTAVGKKFWSNINIIRGLSEKVLKQKIEQINTKKCSSTVEIESSKRSVEIKIRKPFLELLLEYHLKEPSFTEKDILEQVNTFMMAGHETSATAVTFVLYCLGLYPEAQRQVHGELDAIFGEEKNENISREMLLKMKYLECVIKETMRLYPVIPFIARENGEDFKVLNHIVKKGTLCAVFFTALHRDPDVFPDPEKFVPERFLPENSTGRHPYAYVPFSAGPRNCIGQKFAMMEVKTILACILIHFRIKSLDHRDKILTYASVAMKNVHPIRLKFELR